MRTRMPTKLAHSAIINDETKAIVRYKTWWDEYLLLQKNVLSGLKSWPSYLVTNCNYQN